MSTAICTICAKVESPGFYTGCLFDDGHDTSPWRCDGRGNLTAAPPEVPNRLKGTTINQDGDAT